MAYKKSDETNANIINISKKLFFEQGFTQTTIRQITREANLKNQASFYYYFKSKEELAGSLGYNFYKKAMELGKEYGIDEKDYLLMFSFIEVVMFNKMYLIPEVRRFLNESGLAFNHSHVLHLAPHYTELVFNLAHKHNDSIRDERINFCINSYSATILRTFANIDNGSLPISIEEAIEYLKVFFQTSIGISSELAKEKYKEAEAILEKIHEEKLNELIIL